MRKKLILSGIVALLMSLAAYVGLCRHQPPLPEYWQQIRRGQARSEVLALAPELMTDLHDMKGFDQTVLVTHSPLFGRIWHNIHIRYNLPAGDRVESVWVKTQTGRFDFLRDHKLINRDA